MKLIACTTCHTQYDVTTIDAAEFRCVCGTSVENRDLRAVDAEIHRCGSCGAQVTASTEQCDYCGSSIARSPGECSLICPECCARNAEKSRFCTACGVGFSPQAVPSDLVAELPCPCCGCLMPVQSVGGVAIHECPTCHGLWAPERRFDTLVDRAIEMRRERLQSGRPAAPRVSGATLGTEVRYRKCPVCEQFMHRANFRRSSGVIIDTCRDHGTWLDADELEQIAGFILSGGLAEADARQREREMTAEKRQRIDARIASVRVETQNTWEERFDVLDTLLTLFRRAL